MAKVAVLALDGLSPELVKKWSSELPNLMKLQSDGIWGNLESTIPPTTPTACSCAQIGRNPGAFGFWDYSYRDSFAYNELKLVDSRNMRPDPLYRILPKMGQKTAIINVPISWPLPAIPGGYAISSPMTPSLSDEFTHPDNLKDELTKLVGEYIFDISTGEMDTGDIDEDKILKQIHDTDAQRFALLKHLVTEKGCDYTFAVIRGIDRMAHLFYRYFDEKHVRYVPDAKHANALQEHYKFIDQAIGEIRVSLPSHTALVVYSDYSVQRLDGRININEWLIQEGYMTLSEYPPEPTPLINCRVDWSKTRAWGTGSMGQMYINLKGREPQGIVEPDDYDGLITELAGKISALADEHGNRLNTQVFRRDDIHFGPYAKYGPDIFISFDEYRWGVSENAGYGKEKLYSYATGNRRDDAAHGLYGYFCLAGPDIPQKGEISRVSLLNIAPTVLDLMGMDIPYEMEGASILAMVQEKVGETYHEKHKEVTQTRLEALGY